MGMYRFVEMSSFENYLQQDANRRRIIPSERIWRNIRNRMPNEKRKRWPELLIFGIIIFCLHAVGVLVFKPNYKVLSAPFNNGRWLHWQNYSTYSSFGMTNGQLNNMAYRTLEKFAPYTLLRENINTK